MVLCRASRYAILCDDLLCCAVAYVCAWQSIEAADIDLRRDLFKTIVLSGGSTAMRGLAARLRRELTRLAPASCEVTLHETPTPAETVWRGGSMLASLPTFEDRWITREEYEESGPEIVHTKCP